MAELEPPYFSATNPMAALYQIASNDAPRWWEFAAKILIIVNLLSRFDCLASATLESTYWLFGFFRFTEAIESLCNASFGYTLIFPVDDSCHTYY
ncbi:unnamed protein product [Schistosoma haematobium]|nr:unnamed protein product [Schistosoma haematobium]